MDLLELARAAGAPEAHDGEDEGDGQRRLNLRFGGQPPRAMFVAECADALARGWSGVMQRLMAEGFEVHVLAPGLAGLDALRALGVQTRALPERADHPGAALAWAVLVQAHMIEHVPMLVHGMEGVAGWIGALAGRRAGALATVMTQGELGYDQGPAWLHGFLEQVLGPGLGRPGRALGAAVDGWLLSSPRALQQLEASGWISPTARVEILEGGAGVDASALDPARVGSPAQARQGMGLPDAWRGVLGACGPLTARAGGQELLRCIGHMAALRPEVGWLIWARGEREAALVSALEGLAQRGRARFFDESRESPERFFGAIDALCALDPRPRVAPGVLEACAMQRPVVAWAHAPHAAILTHDQTGLLWPVGDQAHLVSGLDVLMGQPERRRALGQAARRRVLGRVARQDNERQVLAMYDACLERALQARGVTSSP